MNHWLIKHVVLKRGSTATSYINTIVNSKSITEAISRVSAMNEIVSANNKMLEQQKQDKKLFLKNKWQIMKR